MAVSREEAFRHLVQRIDAQSTVLRTWPLTGGVSAQVTAVEVSNPDGQTRKMVIRQHGEVDRRQNAHIARDEFRLLTIVRDRGVTVPKPLYVDASCDLFPAPVIVIEFVEGETVFDIPDAHSYALQMAEQLARIHSVEDSSDLAFLPRVEIGYGARPATLDESLHEGRIRDLLESHEAVKCPNPAVLLHNDFWPGNVLWNEGKLVAVIDWEDARVGDPLVDLANSRLEVLFAYGTTAMQTFTDHYAAASQVDLTNLPFWDLCAALRPCSDIETWGLDDATLRHMRDSHAWFVEQAVSRLTS